MSDKALVEAMLFSSPQAISVAEMSDSGGIPPARVREALRSLTKEYEDRGSALTVIKVPSGYSMVLREEYREQGWKLSPREIPEAALRTASLIAYHQPVSQSELVRTLGSRVYDDVRLLRSLNLLSVRKSGQTLELRTNKRFAEYFGIDAKDRKALKDWMDSSK